MATTACLTTLSPELIEAIDTGMCEGGRVEDGGPPRSGLTTLPVELIEAIATFLPPIDLLPLRLTNHLLHNAIHRLFISTHFTAKTFLLPSAWSMQALVSISTHPVFARALQRIELVVMMPTPYYYPQNHDLHLQGDGMKARTYTETEAAIREVQRAHWDINVPHEEFHKQRAWSAPLSQALRNLSLRRRPPGSSITVALVAPKIDLVACGRKRLERAYGYANCLGGVVNFPVARNDAVYELLRAIVRGGCPLAGLGADGMPEGSGWVLTDSYGSWATSEVCPFVGVFARVGQGGEGGGEGGAEAGVEGDVREVERLKEWVLGERGWSRQRPVEIPFLAWSRKDKWRIVKRRCRELFGV